MRPKNRILFFDTSFLDNEKDRVREFQSRLKTFAEERMVSLIKLLNINSMCFSNKNRFNVLCIIFKRAITLERQPINERLGNVVGTVFQSLYRAMTEGCEDFLAALEQSIPNNG